MQHIDIICFGKLKETFWRDAVSEYAKRLQAFCKLEITELAEAPLKSEPSDKEIKQALEEEADVALKYINEKSYVIALCIEGKQMPSEKLAETLASAAQNGNGNVTFIIGSSFGLSDRIKNKANMKLSFSQMTFPHQLMRVILSEQIYRAYMIQNGTRYHK